MNPTPLRLAIKKGDTVLCVFAPMRVHSRWEKTITGCSSGEVPLKDLPLWKKILLYKSYGQYRRANPRDSLYMTALADEFIRNEIPEIRVDVLIHPAWKESLKPYLEKWVGNVQIAEDECSLISEKTQAELRNGQYHLVILLYPDAIGYGWDKIEKCFLEMKIPALVAINGRRRVFALDRSIRGKLRWRRFLEKTWLPEVILLVILIPLSGILLVCDGVIKLGKMVAAPNENS